MPPGVVNLVLGPGERVGQALADSPDVDLISLTGGHRGGTCADARRGRSTSRRVALELGGKSPNIVFADADFETAVDNALTAAFVHSGQVCSAGSRAIVEDDDLRPVRRGGRPNAPSGSASGPGRTTRPRRARSSPPSIGPRSRRYVAGAIEDGARLVAGGRRPDEPELQAGFYYRPTVFADVRRDMRIVREEVFGPVLTVERSRPRTRRSRSPTTPSTGWPVRSGPRMRHGPSASPAGCGRARSGSMTTTGTCRRPSGAASNDQASAASWARPVSTSTARRSTSGRTPGRARAAGSAAEGRDVIPVIAGSDRSLPEGRLGSSGHVR